MKKLKLLFIILWIGIIIATIVVLTGCNSSKEYKVYPYLPKQDTISNITGIIDFKTLGLAPESYGMYTDTAWAAFENSLYLYTRKLKDTISIEWVTQEQIKWNVLRHPFYLSTAGIESIKWYKPPFHIQVICNFLYRKDLLESVWLLNNNEADSTKELDLFESGRNEYRKRLWFADHFAGKQYNERKMSAVELLFPPDSLTKIDIYVFPNKAIRLINNRIVKETYVNLDYYYKVLVTIIPLKSTANSADWYIQKIAIKEFNK